MTSTSCPRCGGAMDGARQVTRLRADGVPVSRQECYMCWAAAVTFRKPLERAETGSRLSDTAKGLERAPSPPGASTAAFADLPLFQEAES